MISAATQVYWDALHESRNVVYEPEEVPFRELFDRHLPRGGDCFEIGCYPGNFLIHLSRRFGYTVGGIDATPLVKQMPQRLARHGAKTGEFHHGDIFNFAPPRTFDVVCSFGFVEHFYETEDVLERHVRLTAPGGTLVISCPNFRRGQYLLHRLLDGENLRRHVLRAMNVRRWRRTLEGLGMSVAFAGYYRTFDFWTEAPPGQRVRRSAARWVRRAARGISRRIDWPNPILSPHMICIARKLHCNPHRS